MADATGQDRRLVRQTPAHREQGYVTGYSSSLADERAVWFGVGDVDEIDPADPSRIRQIDSAVVLLTLQQAREVREDLDALIAWMEGAEL